MQKKTSPQKENAIYIQLLTQLSNSNTKVNNCNFKRANKIK